MPIDTLKASKRLKELGFDIQQAEGLAQLLSELDVASATKDDLDDTEERLRNRIDEVEEQLNNRIDEVESRLTQRVELSEERLGQRMERTEKRLLRWMVTGLGTMGALLGALIGLMGYLVG